MQKIKRQTEAGSGLACPTCGKAVVWDNKYPYKPFCSERCKLIDLGGWASEEHVIAGEPLEELSSQDQATDH